MNHFKVKASSNEYRLIISEEASLNEIREEMRNFSIQLMNIKREENSSILVIETPNRLLPEDLKNDIKQLVKQRTTWNVTFKTNVLSHQSAIQWHKNTTVNIEFQNVEPGNMVDVVGDVVVIGDIKPGGYVRATGSVFIIGNHEGVVSAGYEGNCEAVVVGTFSSKSEIKIDNQKYSIDHLLDDKSNYIPRVYYINNRGVINRAPISEIENIRPNINQMISQLRDREE